MIHTPRASRDEFRADSIESGNDVIFRGLVGAIIHVTRLDLEHLGQAYKTSQLELIAKNAQIAEAQLLAAFEPVIPQTHKKGGNVEFDLTLRMKEKLKGVLPAIQYLYTQRYGELKGGELNTILNTNEDEPYVFIFSLDRDEQKKLYIKKMQLKKSNENTRDEEKLDGL